MFIVMNNTLFIVFEEPTDTCNNMHDKRNSRFPILEHLAVGGSSVCLCKVYGTCSVFACLHWYFSSPWESFPRKSHDLQGNMLNTLSAVPLKLWLPMVQYVRPDSQYDAGCVMSIKEMLE